MGGRYQDVEVEIKGLQIVVSGTCKWNLGGTNC